MSLLIMTNAHGKILGTGVSDQWGLGNSEPDWTGLGRCYGTGEDSFGAGVINKNANHTQWRKFLRGHFWETAVYYVAHKIATNGKGGYFCATVVDADRKGWTCTTGEIYNSTQKGCVQAAQLSKMAMQFGKNKDASTDIDDQCWAKSTPDEYKQCITGTLNKDGDS